MPAERLAESAAKVFAYALVPAPCSLIEGVWKLPGGHNLIVDVGDAPVTKRYWRFEIEPDDKMMRRSRTELGEELVETLERAVKRRLMADVPLGVFSAAESTPPRWRRWQPSMSALNGCALLYRIYRTKLRRVRLFGRAAKFLGTDHRCEILDLDKACDVLPGILRQVDEPQGDNSLLPTWLLSRFTRQHVTVALGGDGGDELFAGYDTFRGLGMASWYARVVPRPRTAPYARWRDVFRCHMRI